MLGTACNERTIVPPNLYVNSQRDMIGWTMPMNGAEPSSRSSSCGAHHSREASVCHYTGSRNESTQAVGVQLQGYTTLAIISLPIIKVVARSCPERLGNVAVDGPRAWPQLTRFRRDHSGRDFEFINALY